MNGIDALIKKRPQEFSCCFYLESTQHKDTCMNQDVVLPQTLNLPVPRSQTSNF